MRPSRPVRRRFRIRSALGVLVAAGAVVFVLFGEGIGRGFDATRFGRVWGHGPSTHETRLSAATPLDASEVTSVPPATTSVARPVTAAVTSNQQVSRTIGSLPDSASTTTGADPSKASAALPSSQTAALPAWRLRSPVSYASGAIKARPLPRSVTPIRRRAAITATATKLASQQFGGSLRPADVDTFFAEFDAPVGEWLGKLESVETEPRSAWFVVFTGMESSRSTGVVTRRRDSALPPTTVSLRVISDVVVVIDDDTGEVLVASEFLAEANSSAR